MFIVLIIGALVVALTLTVLDATLSLDEHLRELLAGLLQQRVVAPCWRAAMLARQTQANGTSDGERCGGARARR